MGEVKFTVPTGTQASSAGNLCMSSCVISEIM